MTTPQGGQITVPPELAEAGPHIRTVAIALEDALMRLRPRVAALADTWKGEAQQEYHSYQALWDTSADGLFGTQGVLEHIGVTTTIVNENYFDAEAANTKSWLH